MASVYIVAPTGDLFRMKGGIARVLIKDGALHIEGQVSGSLRIVNAPIPQLEQWRAAIIRMIKKQAVTKETIFVDLPRADH